MNEQASKWWKGVVTVQVRGGAPEELINRALAGGLGLFAIRWTSDGKLEFKLSVSDFFRLRPYLKGTGCRVHVTERTGLPFWLVKAERRIWFSGGMILFFAIIFLLSTLVWRIDVEGNVKLSEEQILEAARQEGLYPLQWSFKLPNTDVISKRLVNALPGTAWIGVEKKGTKVTIQVVELTVPEKRQLNSPRNLIASTDAVVTQIIAEMGKPIVKKNEKVKKGQVLITGVLGSGDQSRTIVAKGEVRGLVWHDFEIEVPLTQKVKVYTGEKKVKWYAVFGSRALQVSGFGKTPFASKETIRHEERVSWRNWSLPVGRMKETIMETRLDERTLSLEEAKSIGLNQAKAYIIDKAGNDAVILNEIVLHEKADNGKVYMKVNFEVEQSIVEEMPLVQMQGD